MRCFLAAMACAALTLSAQDLSGRRAPSFSLPDSRLVQHDILDYRGKWLIVEFMKTDCPHCRNLAKTLEEMKARYGAKLAILSVVIPPDNTATVAKYIAETHVSFPVVFDSGQVAVTYFKATPQRPGFDTPHWFAIDPSGTIVRDWGQANADEKDWVKVFDQLTAAKK
jgi:thioredoxin-dependent peroxiredoxin